MPGQTSELEVDPVIQPQEAESEINQEKQEGVETATNLEQVQSDRYPERRGNKAWVKGVSQNPDGRPKGSKNKLTLLRQAVLEQAEELVLNSWTDLVNKTIELANAGDTTALRILWDRIIPAKRAVEGHQEDKSLSVTINVSGLQVQKSKIFDGEVEDAVYDDVKE